MLFELLTDFGSAKRRASHRVIRMSETEAGIFRIVGFDIKDLYALHRGTK